MKEESLVIGKVTGAHGIRGELKVYPLTNDPGRFYDLDQIYLKDDHQGETAYRIDLVRIHKGNALLTLAGIKDRSAAEKCIGQLVTIDREKAVALEEDEYFIDDMIGMEVFDTEGKPVGVVQNVMQTSGSVDNIEIKTADHLIYVPARKIYFLKVNVQGQKIVADIPKAFLSL